MNRIEMFLSSFIFSFLALFILFYPSLARADGCVISPYGILSEPGQKALIIWDEDNEEETLILNTTFGMSSISDFCWIIPIRSTTEPVVKSSKNVVFDILEDLFPISYPGWYSYDSSYKQTWGGYGSSTLQVLTVQEIGVYDLTTIWASDPNDLAEWLIDNNYYYDVADLPSDFSSKIKEYTDEDDGCFFIINEIDLENQFAGPLADIENLSSGIYNQLIDEKLSQTEFNDALTDLEDAIALDIMGGNTYDPNSFAGYIMEQDDYEYLFDDYHQDHDITSSQLRNEVGEYIVSSELFSTIIDLFQGTGTPLEITFSPDEPTYPLYISSMATNWGGIDVYFIGPVKVKDKKGQLTFWKSAVFSAGTKDDLEDEGINIPDGCEYVSLLVYRGYLDDLDEDSVFVETRDSQSSSSVSPYYPYYPSYIPMPYPVYTPVSSTFYPSSISMSPWPNIAPLSMIRMNLANPIFGGMYGGLYGGSIFGNNYGYGGWGSYNSGYSGNYHDLTFGYGLLGQTGYGSSGFGYNSLNPSYNFSHYGYSYMPSYDYKPFNYFY